MFQLQTQNFKIKVDSKKSVQKLTRWFMWFGLFLAIPFFLINSVEAGKDAATSATSQKAKKKKSSKKAALTWRNGDAKLFLSGQYLPRMELNQNRDMKENDGKKTDPPKARVFMSHRARFSAKAVWKNRLQIFLQFQDVRVWGTESSTLKDFSADGFDLHQGWMQFNFNKGLSLKLGRMEMAYDNHRIIGTVGWLQQARAFDGFQLKWNSKKVKAHLFYAKLAERGSLGDDNHMVGLWFNMKVAPLFKPSLLYVLDTDGKGKRLRHTIGTHIKGKSPAGFSYTGEFYFQAGSIGEGSSKQSISAFLGAASVSYKLKNVATKPSFKLFGDFVSGDSNLTDKVDASFNTLFATNHKFYGFVDLFLNLPAHTKKHGLMDFGLSIKLAPTKKFSTGLTFHYFRLFTPLKDSNQKVQQELGPEIDLVLKYKVIPKLFDVLFVYGVVIPLEGFKALGKGDKAEHWFALQCNAKF